MIIVVVVSCFYFLIPWENLQDQSKFRNDIAKMLILFKSIKNQIPHDSKDAEDLNQRKELDGVFVVSVSNDQVIMTSEDAMIIFMKANDSELEEWSYKSYKLERAKGQD